MHQFKCLERGHLFNKPKRLDFGAFALDGTATGCPVCGSAFDVARRCRGGCDGEFLTEELYDGWCAACLERALSPKRGLTYLEEFGLLADFLFTQVYRCDPPRQVTETLTAHLREVYRTLEAQDPTTLRRLLREYLFDNPFGYDVGRYEFADWLLRSGRRGKP